MKKVLFLIVAFALSLTAFAKRVEKGEARKIAGIVMSERQMTDLSMPHLFSNLYIFSGSNGFVIVSADDCYNPIVAYSNESPFATENMPDNIKYWLGSIDAEIQYFAENKKEASIDVAGDWALLRQGLMPAPKTRSAVKPLIRTKWDQGAPYNNLCPTTTTSAGSNCPVGCAATAMAQIMKYWE